MADVWESEAREMRDAATILSIIRERSKRGLPLTDAYRMLYNPTLYLYAYGRISQNAGALTPGVTGETVDGMSVEKINRIIDLIRHERYRWTPARRTHIPKKSGGKRPLGIPTWSDKLVQEVMRLILEAHYEPRFSTRSHGFRPHHGCHTALLGVSHWVGTKWFLEGDIKGCFDNIDHEVLLSTLAETIHDNRFLRLIRHMLQAGYMEDWVYGKTFSGTPQGGVISPILSNVYLDKLDRFVEHDLLPVYTRGEARQCNLAYAKLTTAIRTARRHGNAAEAARLVQIRRSIPAINPNDPDFRRLWYTRYADDFLLGFIGPKAEAETIKQRLGEFLRETLKLELSQDKTLITHATTEAARFLGYDIVVQYPDTRLTKGRRNTNGKVGLRLPADKVEGYCRHYVVGGHPRRDWTLAQASDFEIVGRYGAIFRGIYNYYRLAVNVVWLNRLYYHMERSLLHTLAAKHKSSSRKITARYRRRVAQEDGSTRTGYEIMIPREGKKALIARFGGFPLVRPPRATLRDQHPYLGSRPMRNERVQRLLRDTCELCGASGPVEGHHIRKLADLKHHGCKPLPKWAETMIALRRKTLFLCRPCHMAVQHGRMHIERHTE